MDKVISFGKGILRQPSIGDAGELSELVNLIPKNGELVNVKPMVGIDSSVSSTSDIIIATHKVGGKANIIAKNTDGDIYVVGGDTIMATNEYKSIAVVGNTICVSDSDGVQYAVWKDGKYSPVNLQGVRFEVKVESTANVSKGAGTRPLDDVEFPSYKDASGNNKDTEYFRANQIQSLFQVADSIIEEWIESLENPETYFKYVTLGIAALRAYDGTYIGYSDIFTLDPFTDNHGLRVHIDRDVASKNPFIRATHIASNYDVSISAKLSDIDRSLIAGVDIFLSNSTPFYDFANGYELAIGSDNVFKIKNAEDIQQEIGEMLFHRSVSVEVSEFEENSTVLKRLVRPMGQALDLSKIPTFSNSGLLFSYNNRLHTSNFDVIINEDKKDRNRVVPIGYSIYDYNSDYLDFTSNGFYNQASDAYEANGDLNKEMSVEAVVEVNVEDAILGTITNRSFFKNLPYPLPPVLSYPSVNAKRMRVYIVRYMETDTIRDYRRVYMKEFNMTPMYAGNLSICANVGGRGLEFNQINIVNLTTSGNDVTASSATIDSSWRNVNANYYIDKVKNPASNFNRNLGRRDNIVKYSPSENPFVFPDINTVSVGNAEIVGLSNSAKALSQGQFGQFPLYAFCTDGIWALEVASDGSYSARQPISRDVCNNADSITQMDGAVVFTTDQGLKLIQGSEVVLLSGQMDGHNVDESIYFPEKFFAGYGHAEYDKLVTPPVTDDFRTILATSKIAYDYPNRLLRIYPNSGDKWYVYSLESQEFSSEEPIGEVKAVVAGYPASLIQVGSAIYTFKNEASDGTRDGLLLTRPIDMGEPFAMKKLQDMRTLYTKYSNGTFVKVVVYVSNDGVSWAVLPSLRRGSFKYYRLAMITRMTDADRLSGTVMRYELERTNKLR